MPSTTASWRLPQIGAPWLSVVRSARTPARPVMPGKNSSIYSGSLRPPPPPAPAPGLPYCRFRPDRVYVLLLLRPSDSPKVSVKRTAYWSCLTLGEASSGRKRGNSPTPSLAQLPCRNGLIFCFEVDGPEVAIFPSIPPQLPDQVIGGSIFSCSPIAVRGLLRLGHDIERSLILQPIATTPSPVPRRSRAFHTCLRALPRRGLAHAALGVGRAIDVGRATLSAAASHLR